MFTRLFRPAPCTSPITPGLPLRWGTHLVTAFWLSVTVALSGSRVAADEPHSPPRPPNLLLIISDDQGWTDFGFMGHPDIRTPRIDRLAAESVQYSNGYVPTSLCRASLATLLTG